MNNLFTMSWKASCMHLKDKIIFKDSRGIYVIWLYMDYFDLFKINTLEILLKFTYFYELFIPQGVIKYYMDWNTEVTVSFGPKKKQIPDTVCILVKIFLGWNIYMIIVFSDA